MRSLTVIPALLWVLGVVLVDDEVPVTFVVRVSGAVPEDARVFLAGSEDAVGNWRPDGLALTRQDDGRFAATVRLPRGHTLSYKITLGSWRSAERAADGSDRPNRSTVIGRERVVELAADFRDAAATSPPISTATGVIRVHEKLRSIHLATPRTISVWLPPGYDASAPRRYPVLYVHDGQNIFDAATAAFGDEWRADETAAKLIREGTIPSVIIIAIANSPDRINEYTIHKDAKRNHGGNGAAYAQFVATELKPFIDATYRTLPDRDNTAIAGSSLGGLISLEIALAYPDTFGKAAALSPSLGWADDHFLNDVHRHEKTLKRLRIWADMGTREGAKPGEPSPEIPRLRKLASELRALGISPGPNLHIEEIEGGEHREKDWAARFDRVLTFLFANPNKP